MSKVITGNLENFSIDKRNWQGIPSIDVNNKGILYTSWYSGGKGEGTENYVMLHKSSDDGRTFTSPIAVVNPEGNTRAYDPAVFTDPYGKMHWFWAESYGMYDGRCGVWECTLGSGRISVPRRLCDGIMMNKPTVIQNGNWVLPVSLWSMDPYFKHSEGPVKVENRIDPGSYSVITSDGGLSFKMAGKAIPDEPSCDEHMIIEKNDGTLWMLIRVKYGIAESFSADGGITWSEAKPSIIKSPVSRFFIRRMPSGRILLINHLNFKDNENLHIRRNNLYAMLSEDEGQTWPYKLLLDERDKVSYPDAAISSDGQINIIYDRDRYGASEILTARITESEILGGGTVNPNSYLKNVISSRNPLI